MRHARWGKAIAQRQLKGRWMEKAQVSQSHALLLLYTCLFYNLPKFRPAPLFSPEKDLVQEEFVLFFKYNTDFKKLIIIKNKTRCPSTYDKNVSDTTPPNVIVKTRAQDCIGTYLILSIEPDFPKPFVGNTQATVLESHALTVLSSGLITL